MIFKATFLLLLISSIVAEDKKTTLSVGPKGFAVEQVFADDGKYDTGPVGTDLGNVTKIDMKAERTTIPESDIEEALNLDYGRYTPMNFEYHNVQNTFLTNEKTDECANRWMKCLASISHIQKICAVHDIYQDGHRGLTKYQNYCDMYYDNCRNKNRYWRVMGTFVCIRGYGDRYFHFEYPRRRINNIWDFFNPIDSL